MSYDGILVSEFLSLISRPVQCKAISALLRRDVGNHLAMILYHSVYPGGHSG